MSPRPSDAWPYLADAQLRMRLTDPTDPAIDAFDAGPERWSKSITTYFRARRWLDREGTDCYQFVLDMAIVGYMALRLQPEPHPWLDGTETRPYVCLLIMGSELARRGATDPLSGRRIVDEMLDWPWLVAGEVGAAGVSLRVDVLNVRAIRAYERNGFVVDTTCTHAGPEATFQTMRRHRTG